MNRDDIVLEMRIMPRRANRRNPDFVESVDWEFRRVMADSSLTTSRVEAANFFFMATVKGVYIDADIGGLDIIGYLANNVIYTDRWSTIPDTCFDMGGEPLVRGPEGVRRLCDKALFLAATMPGTKKGNHNKNWLARPGEDSKLTRAEYMEIAKRGYMALSCAGRFGAKTKRFRALAADMDEYYNAVAHTIGEYLWQNAA